MNAFPKALSNSGVGRYFTILECLRYHTPNDAILDAERATLRTLRVMSLHRYLSTL